MSSIDERLGKLTYADLSRMQNMRTQNKVEKHESKWTELADSFYRDGVLIIENFLSDELIDRYCAERESLLKDRSAKDNYWGGWSYPTPFNEQLALRDLALNPKLVETLHQIIGEEMALNLALTGWVSTERKFHSDSYLNPAALGSRYCAVWFALDDIDPDAGPFQYIPGSHFWPVITRELLFSHLTPDERISPDWPTFTQEQIERVCLEKLAEEQGEIMEFVPKRGTILIWHSNTVHRGSKPKNQDLLRKSLICHYSGLTRRLIDMPNTKQHSTGGLYFDLPSTGRVRPTGGY